MLDLRNVFRKVSSSLHDFTDEQLESIHAIVNLYRGDNSLFKTIVEKYKRESRTEELEWLTSRFPEAEYTDVKGLCKVVSQTELKENDYSLTPGRYVGVEEQIDLEFDYKSSMSTIKAELLELNRQANILSEQIQMNLDDMDLWNGWKKL